MLYTERPIGGCHFRLASHPAGTSYVKAQMRLPNAESVIIDEAKITRYLLSPTHPSGAAKAAFFARFGFSALQWHTMRDALLEHARNNDVAGTADTPFGIAYEVNGRLPSPDGRNPWVFVVWFVRKGETVARLATAFPSKGPGP